MAQGGIFVFEADNADFKNRKRAARACQSCQKRKKRCSHTFTKNTDQQAEKESAEKVLPQLSHKEPIKFVGDLNPESVLTDLTQRPKDAPRANRIGIWVEQSKLEQEQYRRQQEAAVRNASANETEPGVKKHAAVQRYSKVERGRRTLTGHQKNYLQSVGALRVLPKATQDALVTTYVACIDPLLPIIDCKRLLQEYTNGEASVFLVQAICLVACKTEEAIPYLRLYEDGPLMDPIPFARALHTGLDAAMKADLEADRFTKVQIMTLMSLHNDGPGGIEESSLHLTMAIHDAQTTGLHINTPGRSLNDQAAMLWWTLWTLDKFNACLGGRPLVITDRDIDIKRPLLEPNVRSQTIAVWLAMGDLLDQVIEFYRPMADPETAGWEGDFPSFEELTQDCSMEMLGSSQRNLLEVCYNIIGILACRAGGPLSRSYNRRILSADRIQQLTIEGKQAHLPPLPLVPYAISLSLTVAYRGLRDSYCDPIKTQADLAARCGILESVNKTWWTADAMAKLGRKALKSIQQPANSDSSVDQQKSGLSVADALEAEVAPCKFGPFDGGKKDESAAVNGMNNTHASLARTTSGDSNGLQVLSQAAATLGQGQARQYETMNQSGSAINDPVGRKINSRTANRSAHPNKRLRHSSDGSPTNLNSTRAQSHGAFSPRSGSHLLADTPPSATHLSTITNTPAQTPLPFPSNPNAGIKLNNNPTNGVFEIPPGIDPFCATYDIQAQSGIDTAALPSSSADLGGNPSHAANIAASLPASMTTPSTAAHHPTFYNPRLSVPFPYASSYSNNYSTVNNGANGNAAGTGSLDTELYGYSDLDNLFDGFFDLSMPTMFEDPLFEGAAYDQFSFNVFTGGGIGSGGPSGAGSVDMSYAPNQKQNQPRQGGGIKHAGRWQGGSGNMANEVNKVSPPQSSGMGANHWCWDEEDY